MRDVLQPNATRRASTCLGLLLLLMIARTATGQWTAASYPDAPTGQSHAWLVMPAREADQNFGQAVLLHAPPRDTNVAAGHLLSARFFEEMPKALAADGSRVWLAFELLGRDNVARVRVRSLDAVRHGNAWSYEPFGRLDAYPLLEAQGTVIALGARANTVLVLMRQTDGSLAAHRLSGSQWDSLDLPGPTITRAATLAPSSRGITLRTIDDQGRIERWSYESTDQPNPWQEIVGPQVSTPGEVLSAGSFEFTVRRARSEIQFAILDPSGVLMPLNPVATGSAPTIAPLWADGPRVLSVWWEGEGEQEQLHLVETSLATGTELHRGPVERASTLGADEFRLLAIMLVAMFVSVLVIVLKGPLEDETLVLPEGTSLAESWRRVAAALLDAALAVQCVSFISAVRFWDIVSLVVLVRGDGAWWTIPGAFFVACILGIITEWAFGRSIGKWLAGCRVVKVGPNSPKPFSIGLRAAIVRNIVKWLLLPAALLALLDRNGRHRGDQIAGVAVVVEFEESPRTD